MLGGGELNARLRVIVVLGVNAALQQTLFIVSGSPSNPMLWGGNLNAMVAIVVLGFNCWLDLGLE